ncbi:MAG: hypothetical protein Kow0068_15100 [Marinilabiliales bacterium]
MKKSFILIIFITGILISCSSDKNSSEKQNLIKEITASEKKISENNELIFKNPNAGTNLIALYNNYATQYPDDSLSAIYTYKAAELCNALGKGQDAIKYYNQVLTKYPDFEKAPYCLFLIAFVYETQLNDIDKAREYYTEFINKYPDHEFADDAKISIENLGMDLEELVKKFEENQNTDSLSANK